MKKEELTIRIYGDPVLRKKSMPLKKVGDEERLLFDDMVKIMRKSGGIGLAAPQVGINKQMIVAEVQDVLLKMANPKILKKRGLDVLEEGCLSIPGVCINVKRAQEITVQYLNESGDKMEAKLEGLLARVVLHESDHLVGKLTVDYASIPRKFLLKNKLNEIKRRYSEEMQQSQGRTCQPPM